MTVKEHQSVANLSGSMPSAPRPKGKAKEIAEDVMGIPANMMQKRSTKRKKINDKLVFEETVKSR